MIINLEFLQDTDLYVSIRERHLQELTDDDPIFVQQAEKQAISVVNDHLIGRYDLVEVYGYTGNDRSATLVRWLVVLTLYYCYERADEQIRPEWLSEDYKYTMKHLGLIQEGKRSVNLPALEDPDTDSPVTRVRSGSLPRRSHGI